MTKPIENDHVCQNISKKLCHNTFTLRNCQKKINVYPHTTNLVLGL